jgi:hypothetical protein
MKRDATTWIADNEKFAIVGLEVDLEETFPIQQYADDLYAFADEAFEVPALGRVARLDPNGGSAKLQSLSSGQDAVEDTGSARRREHHSSTAHRPALFGPASRQAFLAFAQAGDADRRAVWRQGGWAPAR